MSGKKFDSHRCTQVFLNVSILHNASNERANLLRVEGGEMCIFGNVKPMMHFAFVISNRNIK